jgi:hypothetical protein
MKAKEVSHMKRILAALFIALMPAMLFAAPPRLPWAQVPPEILGKDVGLYVKSEIGQIEADYGTKSLGDFTMKDIVEVRDRLDVASQKDDYVDSIAVESYLLPGLGQFKVGDAGAGIGFLSLDLAVAGGTLMAMYFLLPSDLRFDRLDYFRDSFSTISNAWNGHSFTDYLPSIGVAFAGLVIDQIVRHAASSHARDEAVKAVDQGKPVFTPRIGAGFMGFNVRY